MEINEKWKFFTLRLPARKLRVYCVSKYHLETSVSLIIKIAVTSLVWKYFSSFGVRFIFTAIKFWPFFRCFVSWSHQSWGEALFVRKNQKTNVDENWQKKSIIILAIYGLFSLTDEKEKLYWESQEHYGTEGILFNVFSIFIMDCLSRDKAVLKQQHSFSPPRPE